MLLFAQRGKVQAHLISLLREEEPLCAKEGAPNSQDALKMKNLRTTSSATQTGFLIRNISCASVFMVSSYRNVYFFQLCGKQWASACTKNMIVYQIMMLIDTENFGKNNPNCFLCITALWTKKIKLWIGHRIIEYAQLEGTHQDHQVQLLNLFREPQESHHSQGQQTSLY